MVTLSWQGIFLHGWPVPATGNLHIGVISLPCGDPEFFQKVFLQWCSAPHTLIHIVLAQGDILEESTRAEPCVHMCNVMRNHVYTRVWWYKGRHVYAHVCEGMRAVFVHVCDGASAEPCVYTCV